MVVVAGEDFKKFGASRKSRMIGAAAAWEFYFLCFARNETLAIIGRFSFSLSVLYVCQILFLKFCTSLGMFLVLQI